MKRGFIRPVWVFLVGLLLFSFVGCVAAQDLDHDGILDSKESQLALRFAPYLHFAAGEQFFPTNVSYHIDNSELYLKSDNDTNTLIHLHPTITNISTNTTENYFLNNTLGTFEEIAEDYEQKKETIGYIVYSRVTDVAGTYVVQYWFFYAYNPGALNQHQGDWEMITIILNSAETPQYAIYSQHFAGEWASWDDVEKIDETHPRVYVALGSHANYFRPYQGKLGMESDVVGNAFTLEPNDLQLVTLGEKGIDNHPPSQDWLEYGGRWGNWARLVDTALGAAGPRTPGEGENGDKWFNPVSWGNSLFGVNQTWFTLSWFAFYFLYIFAGIIAILTGIKVWRIIKRRREGKLNIVSILQSKGSVPLLLGVAGIVLYLVALMLPWYIVRGNIQTTLLETVGETDIVMINGVNGVRVNLMQADQGLSPLFGIGIPFAIILLSSVILNTLDIIGAEQAKGLSRKFITSGIASFIPVIIILVFIMQLAGLITPFVNAMGGGATIPPQINEMAEGMSSSPVMGEYSDVVDSYGTLSISWGLALGSYLFIVAAITKIVAGILARKAPEV